MKHDQRFYLIAGILMTSILCASGHNEDLNNNICRDGDAIDKKFSFVNYSVVGIMLLISCAIGTFYGFFGEKQETSSDFLLGGSKMGTLPMSLSLAAR